MQTRMFYKQNSSYDESIATLIVELKGSGWGISMMRVGYKMTNMKKIENKKYHNI